MTGSWDVLDWIIAAAIVWFAIGVALYFLGFLREAWRHVRGANRWEQFSRPWRRWGS